MAESEKSGSSCIGSSFELEGDLRCFGKPITVFFHVVSVAGRDYGFLRWPSDLPSGLLTAKQPVHLGKISPSLLESVLYVGDSSFVGDQRQS